MPEPGLRPWAFDQKWHRAGARSLDRRVVVRPHYGRVAEDARDERVVRSGRLAGMDEPRIALMTPDAAPCQPGRSS